MSQRGSNKSFFPSPIAALRRSRPPPKPTSKDEAFSWAAGQAAPPTPSSLTTLLETPEPEQASTNLQVPAPPPRAIREFGEFGRQDTEVSMESLPPQMNTGTGGAETPAYVQAFLDGGKPPPPPRVIPEEGIVVPFGKLPPPPSLSSRGNVQPRPTPQDMKPLSMRPAGTPSNRSQWPGTPGKRSEAAPLRTPPSGTPRPDRPTRPVPPTPSETPRPDRPTAPLRTPPSGTPRPDRPTRPLPPTPPEPQPQAGPSQPRAEPSQ
ncbi:hypothetical protein AYO21_01687 [Fonsecaea monophora]|uniref:Uncharacterized protein n=1 Tax=Fonsecaea monophora TaxID=254056 RepID=A0A177FKV8_9EURO|nr:hypothetical protein AYO21_01687 [Fonsecaea monophora]KAH0845051.1 hypothetical protein FOPE_09842 [Fonsecaea pedrosoi]OAG44230.1 hypothetical protein AYO21_01687 [Fonsecaea monophora]